MTPLTWLLTRWRRAAAPARPEVIVRVEQPSSSGVPPEYLPLYTYLEHRYASTVVLSFGQMEALLGWSLPARAGTELDWWTGAAASSDRHTQAWTAALRTAIPNLSARHVTFRRVP